MAKITPRPAPRSISAYIKGAPEVARARLRALAEAVRAEVPQAVERISYGLATWHMGENLIHLGAFKHHIGIYPGPAAIVQFANELRGFKTSKGAIQVPHDAALPLALVRRITRFRVAQVAPRATPKVFKRRTRRSTNVALNSDIVRYNASRSKEDRAVCDALADHISKSLPGAAAKLWHGHPVWFIEQNPVVGYSTHKEGTRLLFWSGQSFNEPALCPIGKFKAAEVRYVTVADLDAKALSRWLEKAEAIQWDYKNVVKNKGLLKRLRVPKPDAK